MNLLRWFAAVVTALAGAFGGFLTFWGWGLVPINLPLSVAIGTTAFLSTALAAFGAAAVAPSHKLLTSCGAVGVLTAYGVWAFVTDTQLGRSELDLLGAGLLGCIAAGVVAVFAVRKWSTAHA